MGEIHYFRTQKRHGRPSQRRVAKSRRKSRLSDFGGFVFLAVICAAATYHYVLPTYFSFMAARMPGMMGASASTDRYFDICGYGPRIDCVVDGDTFYLGSEKIRIADINTPELTDPQCGREAQLGRQAQQRLFSILNAGPIEVRRTTMRDRDKYGRKLRTVYRNGQSLGDALIAEGLAHRWRGYRQSWCG